MVLNTKCFCVAGKTYYSFLTLNKNRKFKLVPFRCFFKFGSGGRRQTESINKSLEEHNLPHLTGYDDPNFSDYLEKNIFNPDAYKIGFKVFLSQIGQFYKERVQEYQEVLNPRIDDKKNRVDILYKFETLEDINKFVVSTDSTFNAGYSSASFRLTENETAVFSGNLDMTVPKSGTFAFSGYAFITGPVQHKAFYLFKPYDWSEYTHLVLKIRGDGRTYVVLLHAPNRYEEFYFTQYGHQLFTRGGPYWQIVKIPFTHFVYMVKGKLGNHQTGITPLNDILKLGISVASFEGPFKLEIDYIGLEYMEYQKEASPFETYELKL